jgi:hypothetical protein
MPPILDDLITELKLREKNYSGDFLSEEERDFKELAAKYGVASVRGDWQGVKKSLWNLEVGFNLSRVPKESELASIAERMHELGGEQAEEKGSTANKKFNVSLDGINFSSFFAYYSMGDKSKTFSRIIVPRLEYEALPENSKGHDAIQAFIQLYKSLSI